MGYVAVSKRDKAGLRDVVFAWRGTIAHSEWHMDIQDKLVPFEASWDMAGNLEGSGPEKASGVKFAQGFHKMYKYSGTSVSPQVRKIISPHYALCTLFNEASACLHRAVQLHMVPRLSRKLELCLMLQALTNGHEALPELLTSASWSDH